MAGWQGDPALLAALLYGLGAPPDSESFDISPRRRIVATAGPTVVPATGSATLALPITLQDVLQSKDGLLFDYLTAVVVPADQTGHLQIVDTALQLFTSISSVAIVPLSQPTVTTLFPRLGTTLQFALPPLLTFADLDQWARFPPLIELNLISDQPMKLSLTVSLANNDAAPHSASVQFWVAYRKVSGLSGA